jgi:uncharacterized protein
MVDLRRIPMVQLMRGTMYFDERRKAADFDLGADGPRFESDVRAAGDIMVVDDQVIAHAKLTAEEVASCARCLAEVRQPYVRDFFLTFEVEKVKVLDLLPYFREEMLLEQPLQVLCRPNCRGLCAQCGVDLNKAACKCAKRS